MPSEVDALDALGLVDSSLSDLWTHCSANMDSIISSTSSALRRMTSRQAGKIRLSSQLVALDAARSPGRSTSTTIGRTKSTTHIRTFQSLTPPGSSNTFRLLPGLRRVRTRATTTPLRPHQHVLSACVLDEPSVLVTLRARSKTGNPGKEKKEYAAQSQAVWENLDGKVDEELLVGKERPAKRPEVARVPDLKIRTIDRSLPLVFHPAILSL
ncbi:hypothetical protein BDZ97DRAFT_1921813 [Flammula alnicola]|nr:hypothetical protein BDZ97DRAFT_1921813 [Flammula alnicola]